MAIWVPMFCYSELKIERKVILGGKKKLALWIRFSVPTFGIVCINYSSAWIYHNCLCKLQAMPKKLLGCPVMWLNVYYMLVQQVHCCLRLLEIMKIWPSMIKNITCCSSALCWCWEIYCYQKLQKMCDEWLTSFSPPFTALTRRRVRPGFGCCWGCPFTCSWWPSSNDSRMPHPDGFEDVDCLTQSEACAFSNRDLYKVVFVFGIRRSLKASNSCFPSLLWIA